MNRSFLGESGEEGMYVQGAACMETQRTWQNFESESHHLQAGSSHLAYFEASMSLFIKFR